jgi:hypothetical protein
MSTTQEVRHVSVSIDRAPADVYAFASNPQNLPLWATGLAKAMRHVDDEWIADGPAGPVKLRFAPRNDLGVLDHEVVPTSGAPILVPMRVIPNGDGGEVVLTVFRTQAASDDEFTRDVAWVRRDLETLKRLLER